MITSITMIKGVNKMIDVSYERFIQEPKLYLDMVLSGEKVNIVSSVKEIELTLKANKEEK